VERLPSIPRDEMVGWSDQRLKEIIVKLGAIELRSKDQEALLAFLIDAAVRRTENADPLSE
jgi:hypothetical protein